MTEVQKLTTTDPALSLDEARKRGMWGTLTFHLREGRVTHTTARETCQPSSNRGLALVVNQTPEAREALAGGEDCEIIYARIRGGKLMRLATERYRDYGQEQTPHGPKD